MTPSRDRLRTISTDPLNLLCLGLALVWLAMALFARPIGDYGVETDFYGDARYAQEWRAGHPTVMNGYRGPGYHLILGPLGWVAGDLFLAGKLLSVLTAALGLRLLGGLLGSLWGRAVALCGMLYVAAVPVFLQHTFRACTDPLFWFLFVAVLVLLFREEGSPVRNWAEAGAVTGLAWLVRYNGAVLVPIALVTALLVLRPWRTAARAAGTFLGCAFLVAAPWMAFLWRETGNPLWNRTLDVIATQIYAGDPSLAAGGRMESYVGFRSLAEVVAVDPPQVVRSLLGAIVTHFRGDVTELVGIPLAGVAALGLGLSWKSWRGRRPLAFALAGVLTFLSLLPPFYNPRFMIPLLVWWGAAGAGLGAFAVRRDFEAKRSRRAYLHTAVVAGLLVGVVLGNRTVIRHSLDPTTSESPPWEIVELGKRVRELDLPFGPDTPIAARKPQIGYVLGAPVIPIPFGNIEELRRSGARYLLISRMELAAFPGLMDFPRNPSARRPGLKYLTSYQGQIKGVLQFAALYEVEDALPAGGTKEEENASPKDAEAPGEMSLEGFSRVDELRVRLARWYQIWDVQRPIGALLDRVDPEHQDHLEVLLLRGDEAWIQEDLGEADRWYGEAVSRYPGEDRARYRKVGLRLLEGDETPPRALLPGAEIPAGADTAAWWEARGADMMTRGEYTAAVAPLLVSLDYAPDRGWVYRRLGNALVQVGRLADARASYRAYLRFSPPDPDMERTIEAITEALEEKEASEP